MDEVLDNLGIGFRFPTGEAYTYSYPTGTVGSPAEGNAAGLESEAE
jgi:hypothetical protein